MSQNSDDRGKAGTDSPRRPVNLSVEAFLDLVARLLARQHLRQAATQEKGRKVKRKKVLGG